MSDNLLHVKNVETYYGNIRALGGVEVEVKRGEIVCMIGANGAGKSTLMMTICGSPQAKTGSDHLRWPGYHPHADARDRPVADRPVARRAGGSSRA
jgi:ABC-type branched-subunit amino acid transport system ATPase component